MNILFLSLLDFENLEDKNIYSDLMKTFALHGHYVTVISPYEKRKNKSETQIFIGNVQIHKPVIGNITKTGFIEKGISTITFEKKILNYIKRKIIGQFDLIIYSTPPIMYLKIIKHLKSKHHATSYLLLKDIFPQNALDLNLLKTRGFSAPIVWFFMKKEIKLYKESDYIGTMSPANSDYIIKYKKVDNRKVHVNPNSIIPYPLKQVDSERRKLILSKYNLPLNKTLFIYGGNIGIPQNIEFLLNVISEIINDSFHFVISGSGTQKALIKSYIDVNHPLNLSYIGNLNVNDYQELVGYCNVGIVLLSSKFTIPNFPSRILSYMNAQIPIIAATDTVTDIKNLLLDNNIGLWSLNGKTIDMIDNINKFADVNLRREYGMNGYNYLINNFTSELSYQIIMNKIKEKINV